MSNINLLTLLPDDILIFIINDWLPNRLKDFVNFDRALCQRSLRASYLSNTNKQLAIKMNNGCRRLGEFIKWIKSRNFQLVILAYHFSNSFEKLLFWKNDCSMLRRLNLEGSSNKYTRSLPIDITQLFFAFPILEDLNICINDEKTKFFISSENTKLRCYFPSLKLFKLLCRVDSFVMMDILIWLKASCKSVQSINFACGGCNGVFIPVLAEVLLDFPSLHTLEYYLVNEEAVDQESCPERYKYVKRGNNDDNTVDTSLSEYKYPYLRKITFRNCISASDIVVAILSGATNLEDITVDRLYEATPTRRKQIVSIIIANKFVNKVY
jgi:hypothetical protein